MYYIIDSIIQPSTTVSASEMRSLHLLSEGGVRSLIPTRSLKYVYIPMHEGVYSTEPV